MVYKTMHKAPALMKVTHHILHAGLNVINCCKITLLNTNKLVTLWQVMKKC